MPARVALESTVIAHGLPYPDNVEAALRLEDIVRNHGAAPATIGIIEGEPIVGLSEDEIRHLATADAVRKVSWRDLPVVLARKQDGATTVAATMWLAHQAGIDVFATGGIGGVHRGSPFDVSADLEALARVPMVVVCAGAKAILDLPATREVLETRGVTVVGYGTDELPAFYHASSGLPVDVRCDSPEEVAALVRARRDLALPGATLVAVPPPPEAALPPSLIEAAIAEALQEADARDLRSGEVTPFLLQRLATLTDGATVRTNRALLARNAEVAAQVAVACVG
ncbi:MAG: pseudouridine-5-phosphate glycosidase [Bacteroidetes bacterium]|jgi:pseudouridine-5'-phosphate glycosidase|nr:pseudouridine-5-phosphate glycosidase [Bacteroidota bacterium]